MKCRLQWACLAVCVAGSASGQVQFVPAGFAGTGAPEPANFPPAVLGPMGGSGSGSTGGGIGNAVLSVGMETFGDDINIQLMGNSVHNNPTGWTAIFISPSLQFELDVPATFLVTSNCTRDLRTLGTDIPYQPVTLMAVTGMISGDPALGGSLSPGTYMLDFQVRSGGIDNVPGAPDDVLAADVDWRLTLTVPTPGSALLFSAAALFLGLSRRR